MSHSLCGKRIIYPVKTFTLASFKIILLVLTWISLKRFESGLLLTGRFESTQYSQLGRRHEINI